MYPLFSVYNSSNILELSLRLQDPIATYEQQHHICVPWLSTELVFSVFADAVLDPTSGVISFESRSDFIFADRKYGIPL